MILRLTHIAVLVLVMGITGSRGFSLPSGITGRTLKPGSSPGCALSRCHGGEAEASVTIKAPTFLRPNEVARCTVLVAGARTGIDISASGGVLKPVARLLAVNEELTHPKAGDGTYVFDFIAPSVPGTYTLYATGLSGGTSGPWGFASNTQILVGLIASGGRHAGLPPSFALEQNFPNPFNPTTQVRFAVPVRALTTLKVYNLLGQELLVLVDAWMEPGRYTVSLDAAALPSGVYLYRLASGGFAETKRMVLVR